MMPPLRVAPGVPNGCPTSPILAPHPLDLPETPHSEWAVSCAKRTGPETSRPFYMGGFMDEPDRPRNLTSLSHRSLTTNRACPETSRPFYMGGSLDQPDSFTWASHRSRPTGNWSSVGKSGTPDRLGGDRQGHRGARTVGAASTSLDDFGAAVQRPRFPSWDRRPTSCSVTDSWEMARRMSSTSQSKPLSTCSARKDQTKLDSTGHMSSGPR